MNRRSSHRPQSVEFRRAQDSARGTTSNRGPNCRYQDGAVPLFWPQAGHDSNSTARSRCITVGMNQGDSFKQPIVPLTVFARIWYGHIPFPSSPCPNGQLRRRRHVPEPTRQAPTGSVPLPVRSLIVIGLPNQSTWGITIPAIGQRWRWLVGAALLGAAIGVVSTFFRPVLSEGITTLLVLPPPTAPTAPINPATFRAILVNGSIALQVITELKLDAPPHNLTPQSFIENAVDFEQFRRERMSSGCR